MKILFILSKYFYVLSYFLKILLTFFVSYTCSFTCKINIKYQQTFSLPCVSVWFQQSLLILNYEQATRKPQRKNLKSYWTKSWYCLGSSMAKMSLKPFIRRYSLKINFSNEARNSVRLFYVCYTVYILLLFQKLQSKFS